MPFLGLRVATLRGNRASGPLLETFWTQFRVMDPFWASGAPLGRSWQHFGTILRSSDPFGVPFWVQERLWAALGIILEPFKVHGSVLGSMSGSILGSRSASGQPTPCQDRLWSHFGAILGPNLGPKSSLKTRAELRACLTRFWDQF